MRGAKSTTAREHCPMPDWQIALAVAGIVIALLLLIGTLLGLIDWSDK
jgi:hypothetical protein